MTGTAQHPKPTGPSLGTVRSAVVRHPLLAAATGLTAAAAAAAVWLFLPVPKLTGYVLFRIQAVAPVVLNQVDREDFGMYRGSQSIVIKSRLVLNRALQNPAVADAPMLREHADKVSALENLIKVDFRNGPEFMRLVIEGNDPEELRQLTVGVAEAYLSDVVNSKKTKDGLRRAKLEELERQYTNEVERLSRRITTEMEAQILGASDDGKQYLRDRKAELVREKLRVDHEIMTLQARLDILTDPTQARGAAPDVSLRQALGADPEYAALAAELARLTTDLEGTRKALTSTSAKAGPAAQTVNALTRQVAETEAKLRAAEARVKRDAEASTAQDRERQVAQARGLVVSQLQLQQRLRDTINDNLKELAADKLRSNGELYDMDGLRLKLNQQRALLSQVQQTLTQLKLEADAPDRVVKLEAEVVPGVEGSRRLKYAALTGLGVLGLGLAGLVARELRSPRVADARQLGGQLGLPVIGTLPLFEEHGGPAAVARAAVDGSLMQNLTALEAVNAACTALHHGPGGPAPKVVLVASAVSGEGKTSVAMLLASSMAQAGYRTLLIDGDLRRPSIHAHFGLAPRPGLCDYLAGGGGELVQATDVPRLAVMAAGRWSRAASYALASGKRWQALLAEAATQFEYVFVDSSPLLPVADGLLMARHVDGVVLSAMKGVSELEPLREAIAQVGSVDARVLGVVLNGVAPRTYYRYPYAAAPADEVVPLLAPPTGRELAAGPAD